MGSKSKYSRAFGWYLPLGKSLNLAIVSCFSFATVCVGMLPAIAAELSSWRYDTRSRSLTLTLPGTVTPTVSVTAPNQLLVELPDTQIGEISGQQVSDGFIEQIALEQASAETVWMVVDFVPGTVLSADQKVTPLVASSNTLQLWRVEPALIASSQRTVDAAIATSNGSASDLRIDSPSVNRNAASSAIAQADFPDLPVLEPAAPLNQPVSVPPIDEAAPIRVPPPTQTVEVPVRAVPAIEAAPVVQPRAEADPPFIGEVNVVREGDAIANNRFEDAVEFEDTTELSESELEATAPDETAFEIPEARRANVDSRWPAPIPFGQPLP